VFLNYDSVADLSKAIEQPLEFPDKIPVKVFIKRLDLIHPAVSGNKWFKLRYNLIEAGEKGFDSLLTFGGAYSNHIYATAAAGRECGFKTIGLIRGEEHLPLNPTLEFAVNNGMRLVYVNRTEYRKKNLPEFEGWINKSFGNVYIIPEGGTNLLAVKGGSEIPSLIGSEFDIITTACGTAGTISGLAAGLKGDKKIIGFSVLRGGAFLINNAKRLIHNYSREDFNNWSINLDYHFGGYAKITRELILFIRQFEEINGVTLDPVYTGKMMYGIFDLARKGLFKEGKTIAALHTGGLQGIAGMEEKINGFLVS